MTDAAKELVDRCRRYWLETGIPRSAVENMGRSWSPTCWRRRPTVAIPSP